MKKLIYITVFVMASLMLFVGCADEPEPTPTPAAEEAEAVETEAPAEEATPTPETTEVIPLEDPNITWVGHHNISAAEGEPEKPEILLFEEMYGGTIEEIVVPWDQLESTITTMISAGDSPDLVPYDAQFIPRWIAQGLLAPVDEYIDYYNDPLWSDLAPVAEQLQFGGHDYVGMHDLSIIMVLIYSEDTMAEYGLEDPRELQMAGEWTWDKFMEMCRVFNDPANGKYAINGWSFPQYAPLTTGVPFVGYDPETNTYVNNIKSPEIAQAEAVLAELNAMQAVSPNPDDLSQQLVDGDILFYADGMWGYDGLASTYGDAENVAFITYPQAEGTDAYYGGAGVSAYLVPNGGNVEAACAFIECTRIVATDPQYQAEWETNKLENGNWTQEDIEYHAWMEENVTMVYDFITGINPDLTSIASEFINKVYTDGEQWATVSEEYYGLFQAGIDELNAQLAE